MLKATDLLTTTTTATLASGVKTGTFTAIEELGASGTYIMHIESFGATLRCITTFTSTGGSEFTTFSECPQLNLTLTGQWRIIGGKGTCANLQGNGSIVMLPFHEYYAGKSLLRLYERIH